MSHSKLFWSMTSFYDVTAQSRSSCQYCWSVDALNGSELRGENCNKFIWRVKVGLHYQSFCDHSRNFAWVNSKFWRICKKCLRELTRCLTQSSLKHFLPMQNFYCDHRNFESVTRRWRLWLLLKHLPCLVKLQAFFSHWKWGDLCLTNTRQKWR
jgi:hypothetical protein